MTCKHGNVVDPPRYSCEACDLAAAEARGYRRGIEDAARVAEEQKYYPDTNVGMRQQWVKDQIAIKIRALKPDDTAERGHTTKAKGDE